MSRRILSCLAFTSVAVLLGCESSVPQSPTRPSKATRAAVHDHDHDDDHVVDGKLLTHVGKHHAGLTAHLDSAGNELDLYIETIAKQPKPIALRVVAILGKAIRSGDNKEFELIFEHAPQNERPKDEEAGTCSHFVAKAPWLKKDDIYTIFADIEIDGKSRKAKWTGFTPAKHNQNHKH